MAPRETEKSIMVCYGVFCSGQSFLDIGLKITLVKFPRARLDVSLSVLSD